MTDYFFKEKLVACAVQFPANSKYVWKGKVASAKEIVVLYKTQARLWGKVQKAIIERHPYDVPCIIKIDADAAPAYASWLQESTRKR